MKADLLLLDGELRAEGFPVLCGVDEAGRGPLAGPVCAGAVILPSDYCPEGLDDSKKLTPKRRDALYDEITQNAVCWAVAFATAREIDELNILNATYLAMNRAMELLSEPFDLAMIDGNRNTGIRFPSRCFVGGDGRSASVAAASILAKVTRDRYMEEMAVKYPQYGFAKHKGYGTKEHYEALRTYGPSEIHRAAFLRKMH